MIPLRTSPDSRSRLAADTPTHALNAKNGNGNPYRAMLLIDGRAWRTSRPWMKDTPPNTVSNQAPAPPVATRTSPQTKRTPPTIVSRRAAQRSYLSPRSGSGRASVHLGIHAGTAGGVPRTHFTPLP
jgi:hypothetical protein